MNYKFGQGDGHMNDSDNALPRESGPDPLDPLTTPAWIFEEEDDVLLAPPPEKFFSDLGNPQATSQVVPPPKVDEIISGEYTGWIPIIRAGESLSDAQQRADELSGVSQIVEVVEEQVPSNDHESSAATQEPEPIETTFVTLPGTPIVEDPDEVVSPAEALAEARRRIALMRASLQKNLNQVATSFEHPIFTSDEERVEIANETVEVHDEAVSETHQDVIEEKVQPIESTEPEFTRVYVPIETEIQPEVPEQNVPSQDHSLELMIMRDEIKDLRDRLDASQKLIEDLMHRLANLAELALKRQL